MLFPLPTYSISEWSAALEEGWLCPKCRAGRLESAPSDRLICNPKSGGCGATFAQGWRRHTYRASQPLAIKGAPIEVAGGLFQSIQSTVLPPNMPDMNGGGAQELAHLGDFVIDIDRENLEDAKDAARKLHQFFDRLAPGQTRVYYSGAKGFHLILPWQTLGAVPGPDLLTGEYRCLAAAIHRLTGVLPDYKIYSSWRPLRMPDTWHPKTGRFKVEVLPEEIGVAETLSGAPRGTLNFTPPVFSDGLNTLYEAAREEAERQSMLQDAGVVLDRSQFTMTSGQPPCMANLLAHGLPYPGTRHELYLVLARYWFSSGLNVAEANAEGRAFAQRTSVNTTSPAGVRLLDMRDCVNYVYQRGAKFSCGTPKSVGLCDERCPLMQIQQHPLVQAFGIRA